MVRIRGLKGGCKNLNKIEKEEELLVEGGKIASYCDCRSVSYITDENEKEQYHSITIGNFSIPINSDGKY